MTKTPKKISAGEKLKALRVRKKISQKQLAIECKCSNVMISCIENNTRKPSLVLAKALEVFFNKKITRLELLYDE